MKPSTSHVPEGLATVTPHLVVPNVLEALPFYEKAFAAERRTIHSGPTPGSTTHAEVRIGNSSVFLSDDRPTSAARSPEMLGGTSGVLTIYVVHADTAMERALTAGAELVLPLADMFWGDRYGMVRDPFGHLWAIATHKEDLTEQEIDEKTRGFLGQMGIAGES
jgi:uncharacterized glyoxalase superfamily protein PhnB